MATDVGEAKAPSADATLLYDCSPGVCNLFLRPQFLLTIRSRALQYLLETPVTQLQTSGQTIASTYQAECTALNFDLIRSFFG